MGLHTTAPGCTRRWPTSARCGSKKTGLQLSPNEPAHDLGYGIRIPGARSQWRSRNPRPSGPGEDVKLPNVVFILRHARPTACGGGADSPQPANLNRLLSRATLSTESER